jgi:hypothetical protein
MKKRAHFATATGARAVPGSQRPQIAWKPSDCSGRRPTFLVGAFGGSCRSSVAGWQRTNAPSSLHRRETFFTPGVSYRKMGQNRPAKAFI